MKIIQNLLIIAFIVVINVFTVSAQKNLAYDEKAGEEGAKQVITQMGLVDNPVTTNYVNEIGQRLVSHLDSKEFDYTFQIVDMVEPNAFALPGGYIYVSRGLLAIITSEDELACVIGHEIIHSNHRHSYKQMKKSIFPALLQVPGNIVATVNDDFGNLINAPLTVVSGLRLSKYSRKQEYEADEFGIQLAAKAGYDPSTLSVALQRITDEVEMLTGQKEKFTYFDNHPFTSDRVEKINENSSNFAWKKQDGIANSKLALFKKLDGLYLGQNPVQGVFRDTNFYQADLDLGITFPLGWNGSNNPLYVGATEPEKKATLAVGLVGPNVNPHELAEAYIAKMKEKYEIEAYKSEKMNVNGFDAHIFAIDEVSGRDINNITIFWIDKDGLTLQMIGTGSKEFEKDFVATAQSFHRLTNNEKQKVTGTVLRVTTIQEGETLETMSERSGNVLQTEFVALINGIGTSSELEDGQAIKFGRVELYKPAN